MTNCTTCGRDWTGLNQCHCTDCHRHFSGPTAFDCHWRGVGSHRLCVDPLTLVKEDGRPLMVLEVRKLGPIYTMFNAQKHGADPYQLDADATEPLGEGDGEEVAA